MSDNMDMPDDDLEMLDAPVILEAEHCACGDVATWFYDPATMAPTKATELTHYCAMHGPNTPPLVNEVVEDDEPVAYLDMKLHGDYIAVVPFASVKKIGSVFLGSEERSPFHRVIAVGPGEMDSEFRDRLPMHSQVGDKVLVSGYAGVDLAYGGVDYRIVRDGDVVATFPPGSVDA